MIDIKYIRENAEKVKQSAKNKNREVDVDRILFLDDQRREIIQQSQQLREKRNELSKTNPPTPQQIEEGKTIKEDIKQVEGDLKKIEDELNDLMLHVPNVPLDEVPIGKDEHDNVEIRAWGKKPTYDFEPKDHITLMQELDWLDLERGSKISGFRGYFLKNEAALAQIKLLTWAFEKLVNKGYTPFIPPTVVKGFTLLGSAHFPWGKDSDIYALNDDDKFLAATAEIPVTGYYAGEVLREEDLPIRMVGLSPCYRREAGAYGKDTRGIYRVHEFMKVEQVIIAKNDLEEGLKLHEELQQNTEELLQELGLHYRVLLMCTGDMGEPQLKKYDTEVWMPSRNGYGETGSNSIMGDFQARRLNMRYKTKEGEVKHCYTLNATAIPLPRLLIGLVENFQKKDGSVELPKLS